MWREESFICVFVYVIATVALFIVSRTHVFLESVLTLDKEIKGSSLKSVP